MFALALLAQLTWSVSDISPNQSTLHAIDPAGATGGRVHNLAGAPDGRTFFAASEWGGLYRSDDAGQTWTHVPGHVPQVTWDVAIEQLESHRMYATSLYDGRVVSRSGINVSTDGGVTWNKPAAAVPPPGLCSTVARRDEPSAYGISIVPAEPNVVVVGTSCGVAITDDYGVTWRFVDPTPGDAGASDVWDVHAPTRERIYACGADGFRRSTDGGVTWSGPVSSPLPAGRCSIATSPDDFGTLFAVIGTTLYESDDGGATWPYTFRNRSPGGRIPFVLTNDRPGAAFDLWFGDVSLWRESCTSMVSRGMRRCPEDAWLGPYDRNAGGHPDVGDLAFVPGGEDDCPRLFANDGGVNVNTKDVSPACHDPVWTQPQVSPHALWLFGMGGVNQDLYFGTQDNGAFATRDAGAALPVWTNAVCCDSFDVVADATQVLFTQCCFSPPRGNHLLRASPGMSGITHLSNLPAGELPPWRYMDSVTTGAIVTATGVYTTTDLSTWTQIGTTPIPRSPVTIQAAAKNGTQVLFTLGPTALGRQPDELWHYTNGAWQKVLPPDGAGGFGIVAVDPNDPDRILGSHLRTGVTPRMLMSSDRGATWNALPALDALMTGNGEFRYQTTRGPAEFTSQIGYPQPTMAAFDPADGNLVVAGGADSGFFASVDGGAAWTLLTQQIPRPRFASFDHQVTLAETRLFERVNIHVGSQGRGVWRVVLDKPRFDALGICARYPTLCTDGKLGEDVWRVQCDGVREEPIPVDCIATLPLARVDELHIEGLDPSIWLAGVVDEKGNPAAGQELIATKDGVTLQFRASQGARLVIARKRGERGAVYEFRLRFQP